MNAGCGAYVWPGQAGHPSIGHLCQLQVRAMSRLLKTVTAVALASLLPSLASAAALTQGNLFVYRVGTGAAALTTVSTAVFVDEYTTGGVLVQSIAMPTVASGLNGILAGSGTANSDGYLTVSGNGQFVMLTGYDLALGTSNVVTGSTVRTVGRLALDGSVDTTTRLTDTGNSNFRSVASTNGTDLWVSGTPGGVRYTTLGATTSTQLAASPTNTRVLGIADGQLYVSASTGTTRFAAVGTGLPTTAGQTFTNLPGMPTAAPSSPYGFFFADLSATVPGVDTLYWADDAVGLQKYSLNSGTWVLKGTVGAAADTFRGLTGVVNGGAVSLFATGGGSRLVSLSDTSGYDGTFSGSVTTIASAGTNTAFRGVAMLPVPEPGTWALMLGGLALVAGLARRARG